MDLSKIIPVSVVLLAAVLAAVIFLVWNMNKRLQNVVYSQEMLNQTLKGLVQESIRNRQSMSDMPSNIMPTSTSDNVELYNEADQKERVVVSDDEFSESDSSSSSSNTSSDSEYTTDDDETVPKVIEISEANSNNKIMELTNIPMNNMEVDERSVSDISSMTSDSSSSSQTKENVSEQLELKPAVDIEEIAMDLKLEMSDEKDNVDISDYKGMKVDELRSMVTSSGILSEDEAKKTKKQVLMTMLAKR